MDEYKNYFYTLTGFEAKNFGDIEARKQLRKDLNCKPFKWYMEKFYPDQFNISESLVIGRVNKMGLVINDVILKRGNFNGEINMTK